MSEYAKTSKYTLREITAAHDLFKPELQTIEIIKSTCDVAQAFGMWPETVASQVKDLL